MNPNKKNKLKQGSFILAFIILLLVVISPELYAQSQDAELTDKASDGGLGLGSILAVVASWSRNKSILWGILHGLLGWIYVV